MELVGGLFILVVILGALFGAKSFGGTIRTGCLVLILLVVLGMVLAVIGRSRGRHPTAPKRSMSTMVAPALRGTCSPDVSAVYVSFPPIPAMPPSTAPNPAAAPTAGRARWQTRARPAQSPPPPRRRARAPGQRSYSIRMQPPMRPAFARHWSFCGNMPTLSAASSVDTSVSPSASGMSEDRQRGDQFPDRPALISYPALTQP